MLGFDAFGGGGAGFGDGNMFDGAGGGGGGYSGGGGAAAGGIGGGGGSFDGGDNQVLAAGFNSGNGSVVITDVTPPGTGVPEPASAVLFGSGVAGLVLALRRSKMHGPEHSRVREFGSRPELLE